MAVKRFATFSFELIIGSVCALLLIAALLNHDSCESSIPTNLAQSKGLDDARTRKLGRCRELQVSCEFDIQPDAEGTFRIRVYFFETLFLFGCVSKGEDYDVFVYSKEGEYLRTEEAPYG